MPQGPPDMILIDERPKVVEERLIPGHWEGDLIYGKNCQSMLGTLVERKTRFLMLVPLKTKKSDEVRHAFARKMKLLPKKLIELQHKLPEILPLTLLRQLKEHFRMLLLPLQLMEL